MDLNKLIDLASMAVGSQQDLASTMGKQPARLSEWRKGVRKPDAHEIAFLAERAGLPVLETVAEIESQLDDRYAAIWRAALDKLKAAGVAASVVMALVLSSLMTPQDAEASGTVLRRQGLLVRSQPGAPNRSST
ncbi:MAG: XRE family transcriptional regulator [Curvibacter sp.]|nr:MAG: XRE family transcriptional regulator [Curvibacter sp.]